MPLLPLLLLLLPLFLLISITIIFIHRKKTLKKTTPSDLLKVSPHRFPYTQIRIATSSFSQSNLLGQGSSGSVYKGILHSSNQLIAAKLFTCKSQSFSPNREFHNELSISSNILNTNLTCPYIVNLLGFSTSHKFNLSRYCHNDSNIDDEKSKNKKERIFSKKERVFRKMVLVYEYMVNGSLQDALLGKKCDELRDWGVRFNIVMCVAKGLDYLHNVCDPPIVHGDIKPSNILLDCDFGAKIADFGLARVVCKDEGIEEEDSVVVVNVENVEVSPESFCVTIGEEEEEEEKEVSVSDRISVDSGNNRKRVVEKGGKSGGGDSGRDWWWKQDNWSGISDSGRVKDYVMEWIGSEINKERPKKDWIRSTSSIEEGGCGGGKTEHKKKHGKIKKKKLEWWASLDRGGESTRKDDSNNKKNRKPREWWKEEFCDELAKKNKKKRRGTKMDSDGELWWQKDEDVGPERKRRSRGSRGSMDRWIEGFSGEFRMGRRNSQDWASGEIPKSGGISSTPSMRGTVCYIAPECSGGAQVSDKCDVYSFGVLLLVIVSGRRPLQVMASPMSEYERANLISWARQLALNGKLLELVDSNIESLDREQVLLCITIALLCLQRSPNKRPSMKEIVEMLCGKSEPPHLPFEFSPSPPSNFPFKSRKKAR